LREPLRFAVLAGRSVAATLAALAPVQRELSAILERPVEILPISSYEAMIDAQDQRRIDGGFFSAAAFAFAQARCRCLDALVAPRASDGTLAYHAIIVARTGSGIGAVADLKGKTVAILAGDSLGARRMQLAGLLATGNDPAQLFGAVLTVGSAEEGVRMVAAGSADAAFAWSSLSGAPENGYSRGTLTDLVAQGEVEMSRIAVIWHSPAIAHSPFAVLQTVPEDDKSRIERFMLSLAAAHPEAYDVLNPFYPGGYAAVDAADYSGLAVIASRDVDALALPEAPATTGSATEPIASPAP
jgi:phosphonate transport system substrate-binding protein